SVWAVRVCPHLPEQETGAVSSGIRVYYRHEHHDNPVMVHASAEVDALIDALLAETVDNRTAALYHQDRPRTAADTPDHELLVAVGPDSATGALRYSGDGGSWYSRGTSGRTGAVLYYYAGSDNEFPADAELPLDVVRATVAEFFTNQGRRPTVAEWQRDIPPE
ncbi:MAG TPA: Imm1 family immunity protein, partial [Mycobacteriales bacterium]|nr:Imm1 family immunity protein [Mycobacteriales bacterium]